jgi:phasin
MTNTTRKSANDAAKQAEPHVAMSKTYEIPTAMRDLAERSVAQARWAFEDLMGAVHKTAGSVDGAAIPGFSGGKDVSLKALCFAEINVNAAFDLAEKLVHAKDLQEILSIQSEYVKAQMAAIQSQTSELGEAVRKASGLTK